MDQLLKTSYVINEIVLQYTAKNNTVICFLSSWGTHTEVGWKKFKTSSNFKKFEH